MQANDWWRGAVIYQIYPRSFHDTNQDGIGDLVGIIEKLNYIAELGVDAIWISPFLRSPQNDFGYDVSDYFDVDPLFGSLHDFDLLIEKAHQLNLKIIMDLVLNHTSDQHAWFQESCQNRNNSKADWYVWADAKKEGIPPNNWLSVFGGSAWTWHPQREQYYLHNFLASQPDLNFHCPQVVEAVLNILEFWLKRGVDGFRLDAVNYYFHDALLRDNPIRPEEEIGAEGAPAANPYTRQYHLYDKTQPENYMVLKKIRELLNRYKGTMTIGEVGDDNSLLTGAAYTKGETFLHTVYSFRMLDVSDDFSAEFMHKTIEESEKHMTESWPCWAFSNHDVPRVATRFAHGKPSPALNKILMATLLSLRGSVCLYQGEELGLTEAEVAYEKMRDPYGLNFYPKFKGRDGCRTPMPWHERIEPSAVEPWLPIYEPHFNNAVPLQDSNKNSELNAYRQFLKWRKKFPALIKGDLQLLPFSKDILAFQRKLNQQNIIIILNLSDQIKEYQLPNKPYEKLEGHGFQAELKNNTAYLPPYGALFLMESI